MGNKLEVNPGDIFTRLTVLSKAEKSDQGHIQWNCLCSCGKKIVVTSSNLVHKRSKSCGCLSRDREKEAVKNKTSSLGCGWSQKCAYCGKEFRCLSNKQLWCSDECSFLSRVKLMPNGCIEWQGNINKQGYGVLRITKHGKRKIYSAHRYAWERIKGDLPSNLCVCHICDNPKCVNPEHFFIGTRKDNNKDRSYKNRSGAREYTKEEKEKYSLMSRGERNNFSKLTEENVKEIRNLRGKLTRQEIADKYKVSVGCIKQIWSGKTWSWLT